MGDLGVILFILYIIFMKKNNRDRSNSDLSKLITKILIVMFLLGIVSPLLDSLLTLGVFGAAGYFIYKKYQAQKQAEERAHKYGWDPQRWDKDKAKQRTGGSNRPGNSGSYGNGQPAGSRQQTAGNRAGGYGQQSSKRPGSYDTYGNGQTGSRQQTRRPSNPLPKLTKKRRKIIEDFNKKYQLYLTDDQMSSIVNSSYMSEIWRQELEAMNCKYDSIYQWFTGPTNWLRVYMYAFHVQEITSDIQQQEDICMYSFESIFSYVDTLTNLTLSQKIRMVNDKYFTNFDDVSFMVAYRFLERKGLRHDLRNPDLATNMSDSAEDLVNKYLNEEDADVSLG